MGPDATPPLRFGTAIRDEWLLDWRWLCVNQGSFGATPRRVLAAQDEWRQRLEEQPNRFIKRLLPEKIAHVVARLAALVKADAKDIVLVENATVGCNAVLRSLRFNPGDEIVVSNLAYDAVRNAVDYVAAKKGLRVVDALVPFPRPDDDAVVESVARVLTGRTRLAVLDHITSATALVLPIRELVEACHAAGVPVLVDGAHGPGQIELDLSALCADWYVGNCHKWLMAPKGSAFLYAQPARQDIHPVTISHGFRHGFQAEFNWTGTHDPSAFLAIDAAIDFHEHLGGARLRARNIDLAREAGSLVAERWRTELGGHGPQSAAMAIVRMPVAGPATPERALALHDRLIDVFRVDAGVYAVADAIWLRLSAHAYNELTDYEKLAEVGVHFLEQQ